MLCVELGTGGIVRVKLGMEGKGTPTGCKGTWETGLLYLRSSYVTRLPIATVIMTRSAVEW